MEATPTHLDLFSGIGGFALAASWAGYRTIGFCEIDPFCQRVLRKHWPDVPIWDDVRGLTAQDHLLADAENSGQQARGSNGLRTPESAQRSTRSGLDLITAGYPCQPFSVAGKRLGAADDRHLWPEVARLLGELRPRWFLGENVAGHVNMGLDDVLSDLEALGYEAWPVVIPACAVNAPHRRDRVWIVARDRVDASDAHGVGCRYESSGLRQARIFDGTYQPIEPDAADVTGRGLRRGSTPRQPGFATQLHETMAHAGYSEWGQDDARGHDADGHDTGWPQGDGRAGECGEVVADTEGQREREPDDQTGAESWQWSRQGTGWGGWANTGDETEQRLGVQDDGLPGRLADFRWRGNPMNAFGPDWEDGVPRVVATEHNRVNRLKALGNAIVPQVAYQILMAMQDVERVEHYTSIGSK